MDPQVIIALVIIAAIAFGGTPAPADYVIPVSEADVTLLARIIEVEARGEPFRGQVAVGAVVVNRVQDPRFPDTVREVIFQEGQFHTIGLPEHPVPSASSRRAADAALRGEDPTGGALFFYNPDLARTTPWWAARTNKMRIGGHVFSQ